MGKIHVGKIKNSRPVYGINFFILAVLSIAFVIGCVVSDNDDVTGLLGAFWLAEFVIVLMLVLLVFLNSYRISDGRMSINSSFRKKLLNISDIPCIIVTNNLSVGRSLYVERMKNSDKKTVPCPVVAIISEDACLGGVKLDHPMIAGDIDELLRKNNKNAKLVYACLANREIIKEFTAHYQGKVYIARTVFENFKKELSVINEEWTYTDKKMIIVSDQNKERDWCNSPYL